MKRNKLDKEKYKAYSLKRKGEPGSVVELSPVCKEKVKKCLIDAKWNKGSGDLKARPCPAKLSPCERK